MNWDNYFKMLEITYKIEINQELRNALTEHFGANINIYTEQDLYEQSRKIIQENSERYCKNHIRQI